MKNNVVLKNYPPHQISKNLFFMPNDVIIRTNSSKTNLLINAPTSTVYHYDKVGKVDIEKIDMNCYYETGTASYVKITEGKVVAKDGGSIEVAFASNLDGSKVAIVEDNGNVETGYTIVQPVADANEQREGGIALTYSIDGEHAASATPEEISAASTAIETTGELAVASKTGVQPAGLDYTAVVKNVGYDSLGEAISAAQAGDTVALLKDVIINQKANDFNISYTTSSTLTVGAGLVISKSLTINGNNHNVSTSTKGSLKKGVSIAIVDNNIQLTLSDISITTGDMSNVYVGENATGVGLVVKNSNLTVTSGYGYSIKTCNGTNNFSLEISNSNIDAWATVNTRSSNSTFLIKDSVLTGDNRAAQAASNGYATICIDGDGYGGFPHAGDAGVCGSNNTMTIENTRVSATTQSANEQTWLSIQYGAKNNVVNVKGGDIRSAAAWLYTETENGLTNSVKVDGVSQTGVLDE